MINFENAKVLTYNSENRFFGDIFRYARVSSLTIQGAIYNLTNQSGVAEIWSGISGIVSPANDYDDVQLGGVSFGRGRIDNLRFVEGNDVRQKEYQVALSVFNSGNLYNLGGQAYYSGIDTSNLHLIENFSENVNISVDSNNDYTYEHSVACRFIKGGVIADPIQKAKNFAASLFQSSSAFGFFTNRYGHFYNEAGKRLHRESYNLITNECSFTITYRQPANPVGNASIKQDYSITTDEKGITTIAEHGSIEGLIDPIDYYAEVGYQTAISGAFARIQAEFSGYFPSGIYPLNTSRVQSSKKIDVLEGTIEYTISYNNDPTLSFGTSYSWEYSQEIRRENCVNIISENGKVKGLSVNCTYADRYANALMGYATVSSGFSGRLESFAASANIAPYFRLVESTEERSQYQGEVSYKRVFSDALALTVTDTVRKVETEVSDHLPVALINKFVAFGFNGNQGKEVVQSAGIATPGERSVSIKAFGYRTTPKSDLLDATTDALNSYAPTGIDPYISNGGYSYEPTTNVLSARASWTFFGNWNFNTVNVE